jgi:protein CMS1
MAPASKKAKMSHAAPADVTPTGDDLDDNFVLDDEFAGSASDLETEQVGAGEAAILSDDAGAAYESSDEATPRGGTAKKRGAASDSGDEEPTAAAPTSKRAAKKANQRKKAKVADLGLEDKTHDDMGLLPVEALADRLAEKQRAALPNLSALELDEQRISREYYITPACRAPDCPLTHVFRRRIHDPGHFVSDGTGFSARLHEAR